MRRILLIIILCLTLAGMLLHVPVIINGSHVGLELWYESVLPSILPFMIITSLLLQQVHGNGICYLGLLCGLPVGANLVNQQFSAGEISQTKANILLCSCNITSPMFILGYILNQTFQGQISVFRFLICIYSPILLFAALSFLYQHLKSVQHKSKVETNGEATILSSSMQTSGNQAPATLDCILRHSLKVILMVGLYIMLFCILIQFLLSFLPTDSIISRILVSMLEITNGIHQIMQLTIPWKQKTALIAGLTSFGGVCSILQTRSVITNKGLSMIQYTIVKICLGSLSYLLAYIWL